MHAARSGYLKGASRPDCLTASSAAAAASQEYRSECRMGSVAPPVTKAAPVIEILYLSGNSNFQMLERHPLEGRNPRLGLS